MLASAVLMDPSATLAGERSCPPDEGGAARDSTVVGVVGGGFGSTSKGRWTALTDVSDARVRSGLPQGLRFRLAPSEAAFTGCRTSPWNCLANEVDDGSVCTGSPNQPTAPAGAVCIYPTVVFNVAHVQIGRVPGAGPAVGFSVSWSAPIEGTTRFEAVWAYTPPAPG